MAARRIAVGLSRRHPLPLVAAWVSPLTHASGASSRHFCRFWCCYSVLFSCANSLSYSSLSLLLLLLGLLLLFLSRCFAVIFAALLSLFAVTLQLGRSRPL